MANASPDHGLPTRGRPSVVDHIEVFDTALDLWQRVGYSAVTWTDLAKSTGISIRTLQRHFPTKADIAWVGVTASTERLQACLDSCPPDAPVHECIQQAVRASLSEQELIQRHGPKWLQVIAEIPELTATASTGYRPWTNALAEFIATRRPQLSSVLCQAVAQTVQTIVFAAMIDWAQREPQTPPDRYVLGTLERVRLAEL
jgi:AcrR family transcriptional regulator